MQITVTVSRQTQEEPDLLSLEVYPEMSIETLQSSIEAETGVPPAAQFLYHNGDLIADKTKTLQELSVIDGDMFAMHIRSQRNLGGAADAASSADATGGAARAAATATAAAAGGGAGAAAASTAAAGRGAGGAAAGQQRHPGLPDPEVIRLQILGDPLLRQEAERQQPQLANVIDDAQQFAEYFHNNYDRERRERQERQRQIAALNADPFDIEAQARIEEIIRQERVMENLQNAMEHNPEVFGRVHMLYVDVEVNGFKIKALVDSGAQATIMSPSCAESCGIMRLVDKRFAGVARGVGTANIIGRVHSAQIKIGSLFLPCSFTVMEGKSVDLLVGLDMLKRYQASIDLAKDRLIIQNVEIPFLGEADIPKTSEGAFSEEPTLPGPSGTTIGQRSGVVSGPDSAGNPGDVGAAASAAAATPPPAAPAAAQRPPQQQQQQQQPQAAAGGPAFSENDIDQLIALGFDRPLALQALEAAGGNVEFAASLLFQGI